MLLQHSIPPTWRR